MPVPLERGDRKLLIVAGAALLVVLVVTVAVSPPPAPEPAVFPSSYSSASGGAKAAFLLLKDLNYSVERWERPATELPREAAGTLLILADPSLPPSAEERQAIHAFVRAGGSVLASGPSGASVLPEGGSLSHEPAETDWRRYSAVLPSPLARGVPEITMEPRARWQMAHFHHLGIYADGRNSVVVTYRYGSGQVIWWAAPTPLTNAGIRRSGNLTLLLNCAGPPERTRVLWDEYYHGQRGSLWSYFAGTPVPWGLAQLGVVALAVLATFARRPGMVRLPAAESRLSPLEFVETLGDLYHRAHAASAAAESSYQHFRYLLTRRLGLPATASIARLHETVRDRLGWKQPGFFDTLQRAERAARDPGLSDAQALQVVQALEQYAELLQLKPRSPEEVRAWRNK